MEKNKGAIVLILLTSLLLMANQATGEIRLHPLFQDHMVFQQQIETTIWGWADPGEEVAVSFRGGRRKPPRGLRAIGASLCRVEMRAVPSSSTLKGQPKSFSTMFSWERSGSAPGSRTWNAQSVWNGRERK